MEKITVHNIEKNYKTNKIPTKVLDIFPVMIDYQQKLHNTKGKDAFNEYLKFNSIFKSRIPEFEEIFRKPDFIFKKEFKMYAWTVEHEGCKAIIFSGKGKGTSVEIILDENNQPLAPVEPFFYAFKDLMLSFENQQNIKESNSNIKKFDDFSN